MKRILAVLIFVMFAAVPVVAQTGAVQNHCFKGGTKAVTSGLSSTNYLDGIIPSCQITVYLTGTTNKATIYADGISTPLDNPFTAHTAASVDPGGWIFWAATNAGLDVVMSGGISPNTYAQPVTLTDVFPSQSFNPVSGVTSLSATAPIEVNGGSGPATGGVTVSCADATNSTKGCSRPDGTTITAAGGVLSGASISNGLVMQSASPAAGTYIKVYPSGVSVSPNDVQYLSTGSLNAADVRNVGCTVGSCTGTGPAQVQWTYTLPSYVNPSNVTAVYGSTSVAAFPVGNNTGFAATGAVSCTQGVSTFQLISPSPTAYGPYYKMQQFNALLTAVTGAQVSTITCKATVTASSSTQAGVALNVSSIYLQLADSVDTAPAANTIQVAPPLYYNQASNTLGMYFPPDLETDTGAANAYVVTDTNMTMTPGTTLRLIPAHNSTSTTPTLALNGVPAATIVGPTSAALASGDMLTTAVSVVILGPNGKWWLQNPQTASTSTGFPITLGSTSIAANSTTTAVTGLTVNNVTLDATGANTLFLNKAGGYTTPAGVGAFSGGLGASYQDVTEIAAPANPSAGNDRLFTNSSTHKLACLTSGGADCMPSGGGSPGTPAGTMQVYKDSTHFTGTQTWVYAAGVNGGTCDHVTDETTAFNALLTTVSVAGGGVISYQCNGLFNSAEITVPVNIRITGLVPSGNGQWSTPPNLTLSQMDLRFNATDAKLVWLNVGGGEIDHMNLTDGSSDCAPFILDINTTLAIHDNLFSGTASGTSACNDAIVLGGTTTTIGNAVTDAFQGYGTYIQHNFFDKIRRGVYLRVFAQAVTVKDNTWSKTCGSTNLAAAVQIGTGTGTSDGNVFSGNLYETANYPYVIWIQANQNQFFGETFWDATGTVLKVFHFVSGVNNIGYLQGDATITYSILTDNQQPGGGNAIATASMQNGMVLAALQNRYCPDTSGSGTAQTCSTNDGTGFTPTVGTLILYHTTTSNSGTGLTINVNGLGAKSVRVPSGSGWTATLSTSPASIPGGAGTVPLIPMMYDGTQWNALATGLGTGCSLTLTTTGTSGAASLGACSGGSQTLNIPQYTGGGGGSGDYVNITGSGQVTATGCTQSAATGGNCAIVGTTTTAVTFSAIPITYQNLKLVVYGKATSGTAININATFNSDTGTNYAITGMSQTGGSNPIGSTAVSATHCLIGTLPSAIVGSTITDIPGYSDTSFVKTAISQITLTPSISVNTNNNYAVQGCAWNNTAAITSITLTIASNDYAAGTKFILYGTN